MKEQFETHTSAYVPNKGEEAVGNLTRNCRVQVTGYGNHNGEKGVVTGFRTHGHIMSNMDFYVQVKLDGNDYISVFHSHELQKIEIRSFVSCGKKFGENVYREVVSCEVMRGNSVELTEYSSRLFTESDLIGFLFNDEILVDGVPHRKQTGMQWGAGGSI